ncbi:DNA/RNA non-specific endonuclease [Legionella jamestowniensis]|uniref:Type VII secretion system protein EssD-like domain-containing protein n=1 Tax=Legionella jamestowniensis TaxID=455 RepID=A0A0W0UJM4_9GAMM|nr:DNA/RNA non-specific endonuclease [Legionella jamestowniensis]KTD08021.1 hypothetical protein Ljam_2216 [Legionella jamestowniensis]SFM06494.1 DNA/RNA non-specific endonuclease [Legionella jamestowniensis DSM 19215]
MFTEIHSFLTTLSKKPANYQICEINWQDIIRWYTRGNDDCKHYLVQGLALHSQIREEDIHTLLNISPSLESFNNMQNEAQTRAKTSFIRRVQKNMPQIKETSLTSEQWLELLRRFTKQNSSRLTASFLTHHLSEIDPSLTTGNKEQRPIRKAKEFRHGNKAQPHAKRRKYKDADADTNCLILEERPENKALHTTLVQQGVRLTQLEPATPEKNYKNVCRTPGGRKARELWKHITGETSITFFKHKTPSPKKVQLTENMQEVRKKIPKLRLFRHTEPVFFVATLEKLEQREPTRRIGQNQLTGLSCQKVFAAYNPTVVIESHSKYHWSHLIAHYFGGEQSIQNLVAATAASNYNILDMVEHFIAKKLIEDNIAAINIRVDPAYGDNEDIPTELVFSLTWEETNTPRAETIRINPRSHERFTSATLKTVNFIRDKFANFIEAEPDITSPKL